MTHPVLHSNAGNDKTNTSEEHKKKNTNSKIGSGDPAISDRVDDVLREFNPKYAVVNEYGKVIIYCPKWDEQLKRNILERIQFEDFRRMYMNRRVQVGVSSKGNPVYSDVGTVWLEHYNRRQYLGGVVMDPLGRTPPDCWNLWQGFAVQPAEGNWSLMRRHIQDVICGGDSKLFDYVLGWLARMVQQPDRPGEVALVLRGKREPARARSVTGWFGCWASTASMSPMPNIWLETSTLISEMQCLFSPTKPSGLATSLTKAP